SALAHGPAPSDDSQWVTAEVAVVAAPQAPAAPPIRAPQAPPIRHVPSAGTIAVGAPQAIPTPHAAPGDYMPMPQQAWTRSAPQGRIGRLFEYLRHSPAWVAPAALLTCFAAAAATVLVTDPTDDVGPTNCAFKMVTGFDCPGCGGTRAFYYLLRGNLPEAARNHAIALFAAPFIAWLYITWALRRMFPKLRDRIPRFRITPIMATWFLAAWGAFWIIRNLPWPPFTHLYV
ncbi:MAG TPA: DUF2752 domain-containing protein, partial [Stackebrandtia sp.]|uniref:DUF2752 domain-containing protein n=1 Tax=Stackebrandtia sp. TaxID=2023065 RepID=UPI002D54D722